MKALWMLPAALILVSCSAGQPGTGPEASSPMSPALSTQTPFPSTSAPRPSPIPTPTATKRPRPHPVSIQALINKRYDGRNLKLGRLLADYGAYRRYLITYRGDGLKISGVINVPHGKGPFPVLVL